MIQKLTPFLAALFLCAACSNNPVGNVCVIDGINIDPAGADTEDDNANTEVVVSSPALDCTSRTCLFQPNEGGAAGGVNVPLCSDFCDSSDDCDREASSPCQTGFSCEIASTVGPFCCQKMCICNDFLFIPESGDREAPAACNADDQTNQCCNLPNRGDCPGNAGTTSTEEPPSEPDETEEDDA